MCTFVWYLAQGLAGLKTRQREHVRAILVAGCIQRTQAAIDVVRFASVACSSIAREARGKSRGWTRTDAIQCVQVSAPFQVVTVLWKRRSTTIRSQSAQ